MSLKEVVICSFARTPIGKLSGSLAAVTAPRLGAAALKGALERCGLEASAVDEAIFGNVISAGAGQAPARQAAVYAGLEHHTRCTTVNKVCASGMKAVMLGAQSIALGHSNVVAAGGFESMSQIPHYMPAARGGVRLGNASLVDGIVHDGLWDPYNDQHMGSCAEACAVEHGISREAQDAFAVESYARALAAADLHAKEMVSVEIPGRRGATTVVSVDEEPAPADLAKMAKLRPAFSREANASVTAANSSKINDGGAAFILMSADEAKARGITPLARILGYADAEQEPVQFTTAPAKAVPIALERAGLAASDVHAHEINEAFSVVSLVNAQLLGLDLADVNVHGGAVAMGHPIGCSGARILGSLMTVLEARDQTVGVASICNGGGGASAVAIERI